MGFNNGVFYVMMSFGFVVIFGLFNVVNFVYGVFYMFGVFVVLIFYFYVGLWFGMSGFYIGFWLVLIFMFIIVGCFGILIECFLLCWFYKFDLIYLLFLIFGVMFVL